MSTDILIRIASKDASKAHMEQSLEQAIGTMRSFAHRFSRFIVGNELWHFNESTGGSVSTELYHLLLQARKHFEETAGRFDPSVLPALEAEGYAGSYQSRVLDQSIPFSSLEFDEATRTVRKPAQLKIDFGGFGKGALVDQVVENLAQQYPHVLVDAGGDIATRGGDVGRGESHWNIGVEDPRNPETTFCLLMLSGQAVATSGKNRRTWNVRGAAKHHLIDPETNQSSTSDLIAVTVIAPTCEEADVLAKTLFLMGSTQAETTAEDRKLPAIFFTTDTSIINSYANPYVWTAA